MYQPGALIKSSAREVEFDQGRHNRAKLGFILMSTDLAAEADFFDMAPADVAVHITRLKTDDYTTNETLSRHIEYMADAAARIQPDTRPDVISYSCTSGSIVIGEEPIMAQIRKGAPWAIPMTLVTGVVDALRELDVKKIVVGTPYLDEINTNEAEFLYQKGFEVLDIQGSIWRRELSSVPSHPLTGPGLRSKSTRRKQKRFSSVAAGFEPSKLPRISKNSPANRSSPATRRKCGAACAVPASAITLKASEKSSSATAKACKQAKTATYQAEHYREIDAIKQVIGLIEVPEGYNVAARACYLMLPAITRITPTR